MSLRVRRGTRVLLGAVSWVLATGVRLLLSLPDRALLFVLGVAERGAKWVGSDVTTGLGELRGLLRDDRQASRVLRRIMLESPKSEIRALLGGAVHHQLCGASEGLPAVLPERRGSAVGMAAKSRIKVGVVAEGPEVAAWCAAYGATPRCDVQPLLSDSALPAGLTALELAAAPERAERLALAALQAGVAVSIHHSSVASTTVLETLLAAANAAAVPLRVLYLPFYFAPVQRAKQLIDAGTIGVPSSIRVRATLAGKGGSAPPPWPEPDNYLGHPAFDHFLLLVYLGGPAARVCAYLNPITADAGGQGVVSIEYRAPARFGALECTGAPGLYLRSDVYPYDLEAEVTGTDGIVFLQRGMSQRTREAPIVLRVGRRAEAIGAASGLADAWEQVYAGAATEYCAMLRTGAPPYLSREQLLAAWRLRAAAQRAGRCAETLDV